jgi:hypothetical protein
MGRAGTRRATTAPQARPLKDHEIPARHAGISWYLQHDLPQLGINVGSK